MNTTKNVSNIIIDSKEDFTYYMSRLMNKPRFKYNNVSRVKWESDEFRIVGKLSHVYADFLDKTDDLDVKDCKALWNKYIMLEIDCIVHQYYGKHLGYASMFNINEAWEDTKQALETGKNKFGNKIKVNNILTYINTYVNKSNHDG